MHRLALLLYALGLLAFSLPARCDKVDELVIAQMKSRHIPGLSLAVVFKGKVVNAASYGLADVDRRSLVSAQTTFDVGSVGKQFTAAAVLMLVERGKLRLEDPIGRYIADVPPAWRPITLRHLLTHTSGLKDYETELPGAAQGQALTPTDIVRRAQSNPLNFRPGEKWLYSQTGYVLLGMVVEAASGQLFGDYVTSNIFKPLRMTSTHVKGTSGGGLNLATGYQWADGAYQRVDRDVTAYADGFFASTAEDLTRWSEALIADTLLSKSSRELMWTPMKLNDGKPTIYGLGWYIETFHQHRIIGHAGVSGGYSTNLTCFPDDKLTVIVLTNLRNVNAFEVGRAVAGLYVPDLVPKPAGTGE